MNLSCFSSPSLCVLLRSLSLPIASSLATSVILASFLYFIFTIRRVHTEKRREEAKRERDQKEKEKERHCISSQEKELTDLDH